MAASRSGPGAKSDWGLHGNPGGHGLRIPQSQKPWIHFQNPVDDIPHQILVVRCCDLDRDACFQRGGRSVAQAEDRTVVEIHLDRDINGIEGQPRARGEHLHANCNAADNGGAPEKPGRRRGRITTHATAHVDPRAEAALLDDTGQTVLDAAGGVACAFFHVRAQGHPVDDRGLCGADTLAAGLVWRDGFEMMGHERGFLLGGLPAGGCVKVESQGTRVGSDPVDQRRFACPKKRETKDVEAGGQDSALVLQPSLTVEDREV